MMTIILIPLMCQWYAAHLQKAPFRCISDSLIPRQIPDSGAVAPLLAPHHPYCVRHGLQHHAGA